MKVYRSPGRVWLHAWWPGVFFLLIGDHVTGVRFAVGGRGRYLIVWRYPA